MRIGGFIGVFLASMAIGLSASPAHATHIYLLKGFANVFSTGLDTLQEKLTKRGYTATVHSYDDYESLGVQAAKLQRDGKGPIIIIGHSLGADTAFSMAEAMKGAPVALVVLFGPDRSMTVPANVARVMSFATGSVTISKARGFKGTIANMSTAGDPSINHFNIEKIDRLHSKVIAEIGAITGHNGTRTTAPQNSRDGNQHAAQ